LSGDTHERYGRFPPDRRPGLPVKILGHIRRCLRNRPDAEEGEDGFHLTFPGEHALPVLLESELRERGYSMLPCKPGRFS